MIGLLVLLLLIGIAVLLVRNLTPQDDWATQFMTVVPATIGIGILCMLAILFFVQLGSLVLLGALASGLILWHFNRKMIRGPYASR